MIDGTISRPIAVFNEAMALETEGKTLDPKTIRAGVAALLARPDLGLYDD